MTGENTLDNLYFEWLYKKVGNPREKNPDKSYWSLLWTLYSVQFMWSVPNDDNRLADGIELRYDFLDESGEDEDANWLALDCSVLEVLVALAHRASYQSDREPDEWFWTMLVNIELRQYNDRLYDESGEIFVRKKLDALINRRYAPNGDGGLFPLINPPADQRKVELWYQLSSYLMEGG